jgi:acyl carrier protein
MDDVKQQLMALIAELFKCDVSDLSEDTGPGDIPGWDSLGHVALMTEIQKRLGLHVPVEDAIEVESISDLVDILNRLQGSAS